jgi:Flp pilus assembly protein TadD
MTAHRRLEHRPDVLWRNAGHWWSEIEQGRPVTQGQLDAVVEASFRIGVHPGTDPATALTLLARAHRLDSTNPKHPYHVGLLYLRHGLPGPAVRWLTAAAALSPVNHRVWAHLGLAYRGLDEERSGTPGYTGEHRVRADEIADRIRAGRNDFDDLGDLGDLVGFGNEDGQPALPLLRPGECRWSGVRDMTADGRLRGRTAERTRDALHAELEAVCDMADRRPGGTASFTVLAVQWMVYGYPPATVRRLAKRLPPDDGPATRLLHMVCDLFESDLAELPARLADCVAERSLPDVLVALIHRQRLLWRPLRFPDLGAHAAARAFTDGDPDRHENALAAAWRALGEGPPAPLADAPPQAGPEETRTAGPDERLAWFTDLAAALKDLREDTRAHAKELARGAVADASDYARISGDHGLLTALMDRLETVRLSWLEELGRFKGAEPAGLVMPFEEFQGQLEACESEFQEPLGSVRNILTKRVARTLGRHRDAFAGVGPAPSAAALALDARLTELAGRAPVDAPVDASDPSGPDERLAVFEEAAARLTGLLEEAVRHAKGLQKETVEEEAGFARVLGDHGALMALAERWERVRLTRLEELRVFKATEPAGLVMPFEEFQKRLEDCETGLQQSPGSLRNILTKRVGRTLASAQGGFATVRPTPSEAVRALETRLAELEAPAEETAGAEAPAPAKAPAAPSAPPENAGPRERVAHALALAEERLRANFTEAWATLEAYPPELRRREAVTLLRSYVGGQQAEAELRLGRTTAARRHWNTMLADDPVDPAVLRNLAVAHTSAGDLTHAAQAWRQCLEALYLRALLHGDVRHGAAERAEVHRVLAGSFGTAPLLQGMTPHSELDEDPRLIPPVLAGRGKVETATAHLRLEELNHLLTHRSPTLLLGVGRSVGEAELAAARDRRTAAVTAAVAALPARVRGPFERLCVTLVEEAYDEASRATGRTRRPGDEAEEQTHAEWARRRVLWKLAINKAVVQDPEAEWALTAYSGDVIGNLRLIDALALDPADEAVLTGVRQLGYAGDPVAFVQQNNRLTELACERAVSRVFEAVEEAASRSSSDLFADRFRRIGRSWGRNTVPDRYVDLLDDPQALYFPSVRSAFDILNRSGAPADERERDVVTAAVTALERWVTRLPGATGPAVVLARLLSSLDRYEEVEEVLARAREEAFGERGRQKLAMSFIRLDIDRGHHGHAVRSIRALLEADPDDERLRSLMIDAYIRWTNSGKDVPSARAVAEDLARWTDDETVALRRRLVVSTTVTAHASPSERDGFGPLVTDLRRLCTEDPDNSEARYQLVNALYRHAWELRKDLQSASGNRRRTLRTEFEQVMAECAGEARDVLGGTGLDGEQRAALSEILRTVRPQ